MLWRLGLCAWAFSFSSRTYVHLTLQLTMRRILATLAVVVALLFSAGSAWADWDDGVAAYERGDSHIDTLGGQRP